MTQPAPDIQAAMPQAETPEEAMARLSGGAALPTETPAEAWQRQTQEGAARLRQTAQPEQPAPGAPGTSSIEQDIAKLRASNLAAEQKQTALEESHSYGATIADKFASGLLSSVLWPGALVGLTAETAGFISGNRTLEDFGRGLGESSHGAAALEALGGVSAGVGAGLGHFRTAASQRAADIQERLEGEQRAWPLLSTISQAAGLVTGAVALGAGSEGLAEIGGAHVTGGTATAIKVGIGATEATGTSAQAAYERQAPLRDVMSSALIGAVLGGVVAGAPSVLKQLQFRKSMGEFADAQTVRALGGTAAAAKKIARDARTSIEEVARTAGEFKFPAGSDFPEGSGLFKVDIGETAERVAAAHEQVGAEIGAIRKGVGAVVEQQPELAPDATELIARARRELLEPLEHGTHIDRARAVEVKRWLADIEAKANPETGKLAIDDLYSLRKSVDNAYGEQAAASGYTRYVPKTFKPEMLKLRNILEDGIEESVDKAKGYINNPKVYEQLKQDFVNLGIARQISSEAAAAKVGQSMMGLSDKGAGLAVLAGRLAVGGTPAGAIAQGLTAAIASRMLRGAMPRYLSVIAAKLASRPAEYGQSLLSKAVEASEHGWVHAADAAKEVILAHASDAAADLGGRALSTALGRSEGGRILGTTAEAGHLTSLVRQQAGGMSVPMEIAGGPQGQQVLTALQTAQTKTQAAERIAGGNPDQQQLARRAAQQEATAEIARRAGAYDPTLWASQHPTPLQKTVYRTPLLDAIAREIAQDAAAVPPQAPLIIDPKAVKKLTGDADESAATGGLQQKLQGALEQMPPTVDGYNGGRLLRKAREGLWNTDAGQSMIVGHATAEGLRAVAAQAPDPGTAAWATRNANIIEAHLGSDDFGGAGAAYRLAKAPTVDKFKALEDPRAVREMLRTAASREVLTAPLEEQRQAALQAASARAFLSGHRAPAGDLDKQYQSLGKKFSDAGNAVTLDGGPIGKIVDYFKNALSDRVAESQVIGDDPGRVTANVVRPRVSALVPQLQGALLKTQPQEGGRLTRAMLAVTHKDRLETLEQVLANQDHVEFVDEGIKAFPGVDDNLQLAVHSDVGAKLGQLYRDLPKPQSGLRGRAYDSLSSDDLRKARGMWEATMDPLSVVDDLSRGTLDYDKADYAAKQYPGLVTALQAGVLDAITSQLSKSQAASIPEPLLTQIDYAFQFGGALQATVDPAFSARMDQAAQQAGQEPEPQGGGGGGGGSRGKLRLPREPGLSDRVGRSRA